MRLIYADLDMLGREKHIHSLRLVSIVLVVCYRLLLLAWDIVSDRRTTKGTVHILLGSNDVPGANFRASSKVHVRFELLIGRFTHQASGSIPLAIHVTALTIDMLRR